MTASSPQPRGDAAPSQKLAMFLHACGGQTKTAGQEHVCRCPAHDDQNPSLNVRVADDGRLLVKCRAGCTNEQVVSAIGWTLGDLMPPNGGRAPASADDSAKPAKRHYESLEAIAAAATRMKKGRTESCHVYHEAAGDEAFAVVRVRTPDGEKEIPQVRPDSGGWVFGAIKTPHPLYRLPELVGAPDTDPVLLFEGEQKADLAAELGFVATSCSQGAGKAKLTDLAPLAGRDVLLFPDNDQIGDEHMRDVAKRALAAGARSVAWVTLPDLPQKGDIVDFHDRRRQEGADPQQIRDDILTAIAGAVAMDASDLAEAEAQVEEPTSEPPSERVADYLVDLARKSAKLYHDDQNNGYAVIKVEEHEQTWRIGSEHLQRWLQNLYYRACRRAVPAAAMTTAIGQLDAIAHFDGELVCVHMRIAAIAGHVWVDLANHAWQAIEITPEGWRIVDRPPVRFIRKSGMKPLPLPEPGLGSLDPLFDLLGIEDPDTRILVTAWLVSCIGSSGSHPILALTGEQGSGKTTFARALQRLVDPHTMEGRSPPRGEEDIAIAAQNAHLLIYENLSGISQALSDSLCRVATGAGFAARKLYTDAEERQLQFRRPVIVNGIDDLATRSDLADRMISIELSPMPEGRRRTEAALWARFDQLRPGLIGALFDLVAHVLNTEDLDLRLERMAEYSQLGGKVAIALGLEPTAFTEAFRRNRDTTSLLALESSAIGPPLLRIIRRERFTGLVQELLALLRVEGREEEKRHPEWPRGARGLGSALRRLQPNLTRLGVRVEFLRRCPSGVPVSIGFLPTPNVHQLQLPRSGAQGS